MSARVYLAVTPEVALVLGPLSLLGRNGHAPSMVDARVLLPFDGDGLEAVVEAAGEPLTFLDAVLAEALCPAPRSPLEASP